MESIFVWTGAGWYGTVGRDGATWFYRVPNAEDAYGMGLGAAEWFDAPPDWATEVKVSSSHQDVRETEDA